MVMVARPYARPTMWASPEPGESSAVDVRVDRQRAACARHRDAVVSVAQRVRVADRDDRDRRQRGTALLGQPHALPARTDRARRAEAVVELRRAAGLQRAADRLARHLAHGQADARTLREIPVDA